MPLVLAVNVANGSVIALGAPIFDARGRPLLAIGCNAPFSRATRAQWAQVRSRLLALTAAVAKRLRAPQPAGGEGQVSGARLQTAGGPPW